MKGSRSKERMPLFTLTTFTPLSYLPMRGNPSLIVSTPTLYMPAPRRGTQLSDDQQAPEGEPQGVFF
jgi:hypothetical protein